MISVRLTRREDFDNIEIQESQKSSARFSGNDLSLITVGYTIMNNNKILAIIFFIKESENLATVGVRLANLGVSLKRSVIKVIKNLMKATRGFILYAGARDDKYKSGRMLEFLGFRYTNVDKTDEDGVRVMIFRKEYD